jgi:hypothetical protein
VILALASKVETARTIVAALVFFCTVRDVAFASCVVRRGRVVYELSCTYAAQFVANDGTKTSSSQRMSEVVLCPSLFGDTCREGSSFISIRSVVVGCGVVYFLHANMSLEEQGM